MIAEVVVEASFHRPRRQCDGVLSQTGLQGLEVDGVDSPGSYEAGDLGFDGGGELLRAGFFLPRSGGRCRRGASGRRQAAR